MVRSIEACSGRMCLGACSSCWKRVTFGGSIQCSIEWWEHYKADRHHYNRSGDGCWYSMFVGPCSYLDYPGGLSHSLIWEIRCCCGTARPWIRLASWDHSWHYCGMICSLPASLDPSGHLDSHYYEMSLQLFDQDFSEDHHTQECCTRQACVWDWPVACWAGLAVRSACNGFPQQKHRTNVVMWATTFAKYYLLSHSISQINWMKFIIFTLPSGYGRSQFDYW